MKKGLFISFEGIDGSGKTTQMELFYDYLSSNGFSVVKTREPGATFLGQKIRKILLDKKNINMSKATETLLYAADRAQHMEEIILPSLNENKIVLTDRFLDSNLAYQLANGSKKNDIEKANYFLMRKPDISFFLRIDPALARERMSKKRNDRIEEKGILFQKKVAEIYEKLLILEKERFVIINAETDEEIILKQIIKGFEEKL